MWKWFERGWGESVELTDRIQVNPSLESITLDSLKYRLATFHSRTVFEMAKRTWKFQLAKSGTKSRSLKNPIQIFVNLSACGCWWDSWESRMWRYDSNQKSTYNPCGKHKADVYIIRRFDSGIQGFSSKSILSPSPIQNGSEDKTPRNQRYIDTDGDPCAQWLGEESNRTFMCKTGKMSAVFLLLFFSTIRLPRFFVAGAN